MRFQADLPSPDAAIVASLKDDLGVRSNAELLSEALALLSWAVSERRQGRKLVSLGSAGEIREVVSSLFERVSRENELPRVEMNWTPKELSTLARLSSGEVAKPTPQLIRAMKRR